MRIPRAKYPSSRVTARFAAKQSIGWRTIQRAKETMTRRDYTEAPRQRARNRRRILPAQALDNLEERRRVGEVGDDEVGAGIGKRSSVVPAGGDGEGEAAVRVRTIHVAGRVTNDHHATRVDRCADDPCVLGERERREIAPRRRLLSEGGDFEPRGVETDRRELERNCFCVVSGEQTEGGGLAAAQHAQALADPGHDLHAIGMPCQLLYQDLQIAPPKRIVMGRSLVEAIQRGGFGEDQRIEVSGYNDTVPA